MMDDALTIQPDATDADNIVLPTATPPVVAPLAAKDKDGLFDVDTMEDKLAEYESNAAAMSKLHGDWLEAYAIWSSRLERLRGKVEFLDQKLLVLLNKEPGEEFEEFELVNAGIYISSGLAVASGIYGLIASIRTWRALAVDAGRWATFKAGGGIALSAVSLVAGAAIAIYNTAERVKFLKRILDDYEGWYSETTHQINEMKQAVEEEILPPMREAAAAAGVDEALIRKLNMPLTELDLSVRASNCLESARIDTVAELVTQTDSELLKLRSFGRTSLREVKRKLQDLELDLGMELPEGYQMAKGE